MQSHQISTPALSNAEPNSGVAGEGFWLSFNALGNVVFCTGPLAQVCGRDVAQVRGAAVAMLLPELPLNGNTARQKVTAMMDWIDYMKGSHRLHLALADGQRLPVEASITSTLINTGPLFIVAMQLPAAKDG